MTENMKAIMELTKDFTREEIREMEEWIRVSNIIEKMV